MVEVLIFLAGVGVGYGASLVRNHLAGVKASAAKRAAETASRVRAQKAAEKRRSKALKAADENQAKVPYPNGNLLSQMDKMSGPHES